ncbi:hypothetical protein [Bacillus timonensis]|uniref:hypothetical protein n=1 Tax=Bacillus timonensis TaxID=1033734 RepID=UPI00028A0768|nr:hypothetical protein [Bacillus timonensis]
MRNQDARFEAFLHDSFKDGKLYRELRLSVEEVEIVKKLLPNVQIVTSQVKESSDGKSWYEIHLRSKAITAEQTVRPQMKKEPVEA